MAKIEVRGASEHNLQDVSIDISKRKLVVFTGVSGSGKSSLVFDTLYNEAFRRFADASQTPVYMMGNSVWSSTKRPSYKSIRGLPPALGLSQRQGVAGKLSTVGTICGASDLLRVYFSAFGEVFCRNCDIPLRSTNFESIIQKINSECQNQKVTFIAPIVEKRKGKFSDEIEKFRQLGFAKIRVNGKICSLQDDSTEIKIDAKKLNTIELFVDYLNVERAKQKRMERAVIQALEYGKGVMKIESMGGVITSFNTTSSCPQCGESAPKLDPRYFSHSSLGQCKSCLGSGSSDADAPADIWPCVACQGSRLDSSLPIVRVCGKRFAELVMLKIPEVYDFIIDQVMIEAQQDKSKFRVADELKRILFTIMEVGLSHLTLGRSGGSLSPGDLQRLRLSSMISNRLRGALYVLDEPCQGLTSVEVKNLVAVLRRLVTDGASIVAVEHHPDFIKACDEIITMGPGAGSKGGQIVSVVSVAEQNERFVNSNKSNVITLDKNAKPKIAVGQKDSRKIVGSPSLIFRNISVRNFYCKELFISQGLVTVLRGSSGLGKSSFLELCLLPTLNAILEGSQKKSQDKIITSNGFCTVEIDGDIKVTSVDDVRPGSLSRGSRKIVAAALDIITPIRQIYAKLPQSQILGLTESHFSWFSKLGRCAACEGRGYNELQQKYGPPVEVKCESCLGARLSAKSLIPRYQGRNFSETLALSVDEGLELFKHFKIVESRISKASQFGLGYLKLDQSMDSLSGGELQRLNLTMELKRSNLDGAWFLLVHPGTGLHSPDIQILGNLLRVMKEKGATFFMLENREEFITYADKVIEF